MKEFFDFSKALILICVKLSSICKCFYLQWVNIIKNLNLQNSLIVLLNCTDVDIHQYR